MIGSLEGFKSYLIVAGLLILFASLVALITFSSIIIYYPDYNILLETESLRKYKTIDTKPFLEGLKDDEFQSPQNYQF